MHFFFLFLHVETPSPQTKRKSFPFRWLQQEKIAQSGQVKEKPNTPSTARFESSVPSERECNDAGHGSGQWKRR